MTGHSERLRQVATEEVSADVVVVGGGTAGFVAAVAAARTGADTILVESLPFLGGSHGGGSLVMGTIGFRVTGPSSATISSEGELVIRGLALEYYNRMVRAGAAVGAVDDPSNAWVKDIELGKVVIDEMVRDSGAKVWLMTQTAGVGVEDGAICGVLVSRGGRGLSWINCKYLIDASGDGYAAVSAGVDFHMGRPNDGKTEAATLYFEVAGIDTDRLLDHLEHNPQHISQHHRERGITPVLLRRQFEQGEPFVVRLALAYPEGLNSGTLPRATGSSRKTPSPGTFWMHWRDGKWRETTYSVNIDTSYGVDPLDRNGYDSALTDSRRFALDMVRHYQQHIPGFEDAYLLRFAPYLGVREGPRILGRYQLTAEDVFHATDFADAIGRCGVRVDIHPEDASGRDFRLEAVGGARGWYQVPLGCLIANGTSNLLVAGRNISTDHIAHGSMRHQVPCMMTGHASGVAAALASSLGIDAHNVPIADLQKALVAQDALI